MLWALILTAIGFAALVLILATSSARPLTGLAPVPPKVRRDRHPRPNARLPFHEQLEKVFGLTASNDAKALRTAHRHPSRQINEFARRYERAKEAIAREKQRALRRAAALTVVEDKYLHRAARDRRRAAA